MLNKSACNVCTARCCARRKRQTYAESVEYTAENNGKNGIISKRRKIRAKLYKYRKYACTVKGLDDKVSAEHPKAEKQ